MLDLPSTQRMEMDELVTGHDPMPSRTGWPLQIYFCLRLGSLNVFFDIFTPLTSVLTAFPIHSLNQEAYKTLPT